MLPIAILAGGLATRLYPLTRKIPKALIDINGEPFIAHQLRLLASQGIQDVIICASYLAKMLCDFTGDGSRFGLQIRFSFDGDRLLGTGGAIRNALPLLGQDFFVIFGDSYLLCDFTEVQKVFLECRCTSLMTVYHNRSLWDESNVSFSDGRIQVYDKQHPTQEMEYIDYGLSAFNRSVFERYPPDEPFDLVQVLQQQVASGQLAGFEVYERFYEIGSLTGLAALREFLSGQNRQPAR